MAKSIMKKGSASESSEPARSKSESSSGKRKRSDDEEDSDVSDEQDYDFNVVLYPKQNKRRSNVKTEEQGSSFDEKLVSSYSITPAELWNNMTRYRIFSIQGESFRLEDIVLVKNSGDGNEEPEPESKDGALVPMVDYLKDRWVAQILEVRALDESKVFVRVHWLYRPEDMEPKGREPHHGSHELIASNYMQIIDAQTVDAKVVVRQWNEINDEEDPDPEELFWRQTLDCTKPKSVLSQLRSHCICKKPRNPNKLVVQCKSPTCQVWLHSECIEEAAQERLQKGTASKDSVMDPLGKEAAHTVEDGKAESEKITVRLDEVKGWADGEATVKLVCSRPRQGLDAETWEEDILCLACQEKIE